MDSRLNVFVVALTKVAGVLLAVLLVMQVSVVALRYVFSFGASWTQDAMVYLFFFSVLLPGLAVLLLNKSVRVDVFYANWSRRRRNLLDRIALLALLAPATAYAAWASLGPTLNSWSVYEASPTIGGLPGYFLLKTTLTLFFVLLSLLALYMGLRPRPFGKDDVK